MILITEVSPPIDPVLDQCLLMALLLQRQIFLKVIESISHKIINEINRMIKFHIEILEKIETNCINLYKMIERLVKDKK